MLVIMLYMSLLMDLATLSARLSTYVLAPWPAFVEGVDDDGFTSMKHADVPADFPDFTILFS